MNLKVCNLCPALEITGYFMLCSTNPSYNLPGLSLCSNFKIIFSVSCTLLPIWIRYKHDDEDEPPELPPPLFTAEEHFRPSLEVDPSLLPSQEKEKPELTIR